VKLQVLVIAQRGFLRPMDDVPELFRAVAKSIVGMKAASKPIYFM